MTIPTPCPYLSGKMERKIFTQINDTTALGLNDYLTHSGFRRSQNVLYRPACEACQECRSLRILVDQFSPTKSMRRTLARNQHISRNLCDAIATPEQYELLRQYLLVRHAGGGMTDMDFMRYEMMAENSTSSTGIIEYRDHDDTLVACALIDYLMDGLSMVYSFFSPDLDSQSLGHYMILDNIALAQSMGLPYLYLGYWVKNSSKMDYKARYRPCEILGVNGWAPYEDQI